MNNIVLYRMIVSIWILVLAISLSAQKPAIDLIPSSHQITQREAVVDTSFALDTLVQNNPNIQPPAAQEENTQPENIKKERRQIGPSIDSLFRKAENKHAASNKTTGSISLFIIKFNPLKFFISIIAIK